MTAAATRCDVLGLYRRIFRIARTWQSLSGLSDDTLKEKQYIITEAKTLFRKNKNLTDVKAIKLCILECHARIEMGLHYRIPYPRPANLEQKRQSGQDSSPHCRGTFTSYGTC
ncbi:LYR motif containing protein 1 isoform X3 [Heptranchias perlo]|uniref:LYR motif containing protein 1 isoform X3 n=1 Tax=Heptranchias perlo TaxID=212740 RepID=UPI00355AB8D3